MSETMGECLRGVYTADNRYEEHVAIADAIDRIAADVAAVKAKVDAVSLEDVKHFVESEKAWVALVTEQRDEAIRERDAALAEVERLKAMFEQQPPAAPPPAAPPAGWLTDEERRALSRAFDLLCDDDGDSPLAGTVQALLARAGSPPVVEVPPMQSWEYTAHEEALAYRAALDKAGVKWKEVGRE